MKFPYGAIERLLPIVALVAAALAAPAQSGNAGTVRGTITDPSGAVIPGANVHLANQMSGLDRSATSDDTGQFAIPNVPFNPYRIVVTANGFANLSQSVQINSSLGTVLKLVMQIAGASQTVTVESSGDLIEDDPTYHTDVDRDMFNKVPLESASSTLSSLVTLTTPGVSADSNGLFHGLGDHAMIGGGHFWGQDLGETAFNSVQNGHGQRAKTKKSPVVAPNNGSAFFVSDQCAIRP